MPSSPHPDDGIEIEGKDRKQAWAVWAVMVIIMTAINVSVWLYFQHRQNVAQQQYARQQAEERRAEQQAYDLDSTGAGIVRDIMSHTPRGAPPRSIPFSRVLGWERDLRPQYQLTPTASYRSTGMFNLRIRVSGATACVIVPGHKESLVQQGLSPVVDDTGPCSSLALTPPP